MKNSKKKFLAAMSIFVGASLVIFEVVQSTARTVGGDAAPTNYSLSFDKDTNRMFEGTGTSSGSTTGTYTATTSLGNPIAFKYDLGAKITKKNWHTFLAGSYFQNTTALTSLSSLVISTSTGEALTIEWSKYADFSSSSSIELSTSATEKTVTFDDTYPSYFRISSTKTHEIYLKTLVINYLCSTTPDPSSSTSSEEPSSSESSPESSSESSSSASSSSTLAKTELRYGMEDYISNNIYDISACPSNGNPKLLIIPVWFSDSSSILSNETYKANVKEDIEKGFLGSEEETGWHSVSSYYYEESDGALNITGVVTDWYEVNYTIAQVGKSDSITNTIVEEATNSYFSNSGANRQDFDYDGDGYLDGVMVIYAAPDYSNSGYSNYDNLWAYTYWLQGYASVASPQANAYFWCSYDFMYDADSALERTGKSYSSGDTSNCSIDAHTFIHEFGHVLGLNDYYDYGGNYNPAGGFSMQDYNVGAHDPYSDMLLGWADPYIPTESCTIEIGAFQSTKDLILLSPSWNSYDSPFDEYLLLELYTPTGLNEFDSVNQYDVSYPKGPSTTGIRLWHVDARLTTITSGNRYSTSFFTNPSSPSNGSLIAMTNTYSGSYITPLGNSYVNYNELQLIRNSTSATYRPSDDLSSSSLFTDGDTFSMSSYSKQFVNGTSLNSRTSLGWSFSVSISGSGDNAKASITCTKN